MKKGKVVVVGVGIVGACCAYYAARSGMEVIALDASDIGKGTTDATGSSVTCVTKNSSELLELTKRSMALFQELQKDFNVFYRVDGSYILSRSLEEEHFLLKRGAWLKEHGVDNKIIPGRELRNLLPYIHPDVKGALYTTKDAGVFPRESCLAIAKEAEKFGASIKTNTTVKDFYVVNDTIKGVITSSGTIECDYVVIAAGPWSGSLTEKIGLKIPLSLQKGESLITEPVNFHIKGQMLAADILIKKLKHSFPEEFSTGMYVSQEPDMTMKLGNTREWADFDLKTTERGRKGILEEVSKYFPELSHLNICNHSVGFRAFTPYKRPFVCNIKKPKGLVLACGHGGEGVALAPITGWQVSQLLLGITTGLEDTLSYI